MKPGKFTFYVLPLALGLAMLAAGCKGQEKAKPAAPARPAPPAAAPAAPAPRAEAPPAAAPLARARTGGKVVKSVATAQGTLRIVRYGKGRSAEFAAVLGDRTLVEPEVRPIEVAARRPAKGKASLVLLRFPRGDKGCPARFRVADLTRGSDPRVSDEFGNCSAHPRASGSAGGWKLAFPKSKGAAPKNWIYANGELREVAKKGSPKGSSKTASRQAPPGYKAPEYTGLQPPPAQPSQ